MKTTTQVPLTDMGTTGLVRHAFHGCKFTHWACPWIDTARLEEAENEASRRNPQNPEHAAFLMWCAVMARAKQLQQMYLKKKKAQGRL